LAAQVQQATAMMGAAGKKKKPRWHSGRDVCIRQRLFGGEGRGIICVAKFGDFTVEGVRSRWKRSRGVVRGISLERGGSGDGN